MLVPISPQERSLLDWPGKSPVREGDPFHPAAYHMLDVAAVAEILLDLWTPPGLTTAQKQALCLLVALHDLGKFNPFFRAMLEQGEKQGEYKHWQVSDAWLQHETITNVLLKHLDLDPDMGDLILCPLTVAVAGHHGRPSRKDSHGIVTNRRIRTEGFPAALACVQALCTLWPDASLQEMSLSRAQTMSWWLSGLTVAADWIGSNADWFPLRNPVHSLADYREIARQQAITAIDKAEILPPAPEGRALFDFTLRPMQEAAREIPLPDGPTLIFLEEETGAGKTEAALLLAQRMLLEGKGRGLYFALPTTATADAMFSRLWRSDSLKRLFALPPVLALAHGRAAFSKDFREWRDQFRESDDMVGGDWIGDNRRRALLAHVGIGTIDQALLAILPTKFSTLRVWGLASKLLIVDEVHELGEPYLEQELEQLLHLHALNGGSAILLTATLPLRLRQKLSKAFLAGTGQTAEPDLSPAYPSLSIVGGAAQRDFPSRTSAKGTVVVQRIAGIEDALHLLEISASKGAACVWVRNSVDDAIAAVKALRERGLEANLLHARYTLHDRKRIEAGLHERFGPDSLKEKRAGQIMVGTQVLEASLDLDFDVMVSDLAPMAALIQRAGRLWRHKREARPVPGPVLHVVAPDPAEVQDDRWLHSLQPGGAWVYPLADQWRTADTLFRVGEIVAPEGLRELIEAVHGDACVDVPAVLQDRENEALGEASSRAGLARQNRIDLAKDYRDGGGEDDREYPTRLGQETRTLLLVRREGETLTPWATEGANHDSSDTEQKEQQAFSEVSVGVSRLKGLSLPDQSDPVVIRFTHNWPEWRRNTVIICPVAPDGAICEGLRYQSDLGLVSASPHNRE